MARNIRPCRCLAEFPQIFSHTCLNDMLFAAQRIKFILPDMRLAHGIDVCLLYQHNRLGIVSTAVIFRVCQITMRVTDIGPKRDGKLYAIDIHQQADVRAVLFLFNFTAVNICLVKCIAQEYKFERHVFSPYTESAPYYYGAIFYVSFLLFTLFALYEQINSVSFFYFTLTLYERIFADFSAHILYAIRQQNAIHRRTEIKEDSPPFRGKSSFRYWLFQP
ncbi:MAG: hypothetical protein Q4C54_00735 [Clostridia bacterium]|nr:hypothetical protein [Clostridia bacterium]